MREKEKEIQGLFDSAEEFREITRPTAAFITFEEEDAKLLAMSNNKRDKKFYGKNLEFLDASEPTDIIWENRYLTRKAIFWREICAWIVIAILMSGSFVIVYYVSGLSAKIARVFPTVDCDTLLANYGSEIDEFALADYNFIEDHPGMQSSGCLQCFCQHSNEDPTITYPEGDADGIAICEQYNNKMMEVLIWTESIAYILVGLNYVLRTACIMLVQWIGYHTETMKLERTSTVTFLVTFFNTAFLLLLINCNWSEQFFSFGLINGDMADFNGQWFKTVGALIIYTMAFNSVYPVLEACGYWGMRIGFRILDGGCGCGKDRKYSTKSTSIQQYINVYAGPIYFMHFKYSAIENICFVTFMYGFGMPTLFPIAALSFIILYLTERSMLFYAYQLPPMYDHRLSESVLNKLAFAPVMFLFFGYWMVSS